MKYNFLNLLDDYLDAVRKTERNITEIEDWIDRPKPTVDVEPPTLPDRRDMLGRLDRLMELIPLILQTDSTRVITLLIQDPDVKAEIPGVEETQHILSHHGQDERKIEQLRIIESGIVSQVSGLLKNMKDKTGHGKRLLESTSIVFGSNLGNANSHAAHNLPSLFAGGGFNHGSYWPTINTTIQNSVISS